MTSPHSGYPHQAPGYYQPSPPPSHVYGTHSPGPGHSPNPYPYLYPHPPHVNSHHTPLHHHPPSSGRMNARGAGNSYASRASHGHGHHPHIYHQNFHPPPPPPPPQHQPYAHPLLHAPHPQHPHPQHPAKYPHPYTPPYPYPSPTLAPAAPYSPSWQPQQQQPQSPLPKQLSMPPPRGFSPAYYEPPAAPPPQIAPPIAVAHEPPAAATTPTSSAVAVANEAAADAPSTVQPTAVQAEQLPESSTIEAPVVPKEDAEQSTEDQPSTKIQVPQVPDSSTSTSPPPSAAQPRSPSITSTPSTAPVPLPIQVPTTTTTTYTMGSITNTAGDNTPLSPTHSVSSVKSRSHKPSSPPSYASIAIWSRRPGDPSKAPGIIISPRARPPEDIVSKALDVRTPPPSPSKSVPVTLPVEEKVEEEGVEEQLEAVPRDKDITSVIGTQQADSTISSSAVTEVTDAPTLPGSPISTNTSISVAGGSPAKEATTSAATITGVTPVVDEKNEIPVTAAGEATTPSVSTSKPHEPPTTSTPPPTKTAPSKPAPPKSWASLFSSSSTPSSSTAGATTAGSSSTTHPQRSALPTSSVVGISIPAPSSTPVVPVIPAKKSELLNLLTNGPGGAPAASSGIEKIRPRGLINSGNMCFANAVLQVLVYCAPFQRLFIELGRMLVKEPPPSAPPVASSTSGVTVIPNGSVHANGNGKAVKSQTPFIDATVEFLKEFVVEEDKEKRNGERKRKGATDGFSSSGRGGKGKEKEVVGDADGNADGTEGDEWPESFLPSYVYEAMKEKKRFESMRGGQQEDAEEFLGFYLDTLEEELLCIQNALAPPPKVSKQQQQQAVEEKEEPEPLEEDGWLEVGKKNRMIVTRTIKAVESPITRIFGGKFKSTLKAPGQKDSVLVEDWRSLRIDIQRDSIHTIQDALTHITHPQSIQMTHPSRPGVTIDANQKVLIEALPPVLVLHVKRFCYDIAVGGVVKVMKQVRFEPELEIGSDMMAPGKRPQSAKYRLFGAIYHHGHSASGGHYTLDVLHPNRYPGAKLREGWVRIDDELVSDVRSEDVFDAWEKDEMRNAYLLFYRRIRS